ncbi:MAG: hypothetical protein ACI4GA_03970 [Acutalibacteraceae bacterium]
MLNSIIHNPELVEKAQIDAKSYIPNLEVIKKENELGYQVEQKSKDFKILANDVLSLASLKFGCCSEFSDAEYTEAFKEYLEERSPSDSLDYKLLVDVVDKIMINEKGVISIMLVNNTVLYYEEGEYINATCKNCN